MVYFDERENSAKGKIEAEIKYKKNADRRGYERVSIVGDITIYNSGATSQGFF